MSRAFQIWLAVTALTATASAQPHTEAGLAWRVPVSCPDAADVRARIERRLGMSIDRAVHGVEVDIALEGDGRDRRFVARIDLRAVTVENEVRVLTSARCEELTDAVAVVIARVAAERRERAELPRAREGIAAAASGADPPRTAARTWGGGARAMGVSGIGALPRIGIGGELAGYAWSRSWFVEVSATRWMRSSSFLAPGAPGRVDLQLDLATLRIGWRSARLPLRAWLGGELGAVRGAGVALHDGHAGQGRWTAIDAGFGVAWPMSPRTRLVGIIELGIPIARARFLLRDGSEVFRPEAVNARSGLGLEVGW